MDQASRGVREGLDRNFSALLAIARPALLLITRQAGSIQSKFWKRNIYIQRGKKSRMDV